MHGQSWMNDDDDDGDDDDDDGDGDCNGGVTAAGCAAEV